MANFGWANVLTASRLLLVVPCIYGIVAGHLILAAIVFGCAVTTDFADGVVARARGEVSAIGGLFDHSVDAIFVALSLGALAWFRPSDALNEPLYESLYIPGLLPPLIVLSFFQYALDSQVIAGHPLRASALGRYNGVGYFVLLGIAVIGAALALPAVFLEWVLSAFGWLLVVSTLVSMLDRLLAYRKARDSL